MSASRINAIQVLLWTVLALWIIPSRGHFLYDEAYLYHQVVAVARHGHPSVFGVPISSTSPIAFVPGGSLYLLLAPPFLFTANPEWGTAWLILLSSAGVWALDRALRFANVSAISRVCAVAMVTWASWHARSVDRLWNPNVLWGLSLMLLSVALRLRYSDRRAPWLVVAFGVLAALMVQAHIAAVLGVAACLILAVSGSRRIRPLAQWLPAVVVMAIMFAPYIVMDGAQGFANTRALRSAQQFAGWNTEAVGLSAAMPFAAFTAVGNAPLFVSELGHLVRSRDIVRNLTIPIGLALLIAGSAGFWLRERRGRPFALWCWAIGPIFFLLNQRHYADHYLFSLVPLLLALAGWGMGAMVERGRGFARASAALVGVWILAQTIVWVPEYHSGSHVPTVAAQIADARIAALRILPTPSLPRDPQAFIVSTLARELFEQDVSFEVLEVYKTCVVRFGEDDGDRTEPLGPNTYFDCQ